MKNQPLLIFTAALLFAAGSSARALDFPSMGFQIDPLETSPSSPPTQALMLFLPAESGFAPNVNVVIQPYGGTREDYIKLSKGQFDQMELKIISEKTPSDNEWICEYSGDLQGSLLHWYARAILASGKVYLVTATSRDANWAAVSDPLKKCVDSFKIDSSKK